MTRDERILCGLAIGTVADDGERERLSVSVLVESLIDMASKRTAGPWCALEGPGDEPEEPEPPPVRPQIVIVHMPRPSRRLGLTPGRPRRRRSGRIR